VLFHGGNGLGDMWARLAFNEWFDGELNDQQ
jgi:hypothetical protein